MRDEQARETARLVIGGERFGRKMGNRQRPGGQNHARPGVPSGTSPPSQTSRPEEAKRRIAGKERVKLREASKITKREEKRTEIIK